MSTNAACMPGSTRDARPLYRLPTMPLRLARSIERRAILDDGSADLARVDVDEDLAAHAEAASQQGTPAAASSPAVSNSGNPMTPE